MQYRALEDLLAHIVVDGCAGLAQEQRERVPVADQVVQRLAQAAIGFDQALVELLGHPALKAVHDGPAVLLVEGQALLGRTGLLAALRVVLVDLGQSLDDVAGRLGELLGHIDHLAPSVRQAVRQDGGELAGDVAPALSEPA